MPATDTNRSLLKAIVMSSINSAPPRELLFKPLSGKRDVNAVHGDVTALLNAGILSKTDDGKIVFPYDIIHVDFTLKAA